MQQHSTLMLHLKFSINCCKYFCTLRTTHAWCVCLNHFVWRFNNIVVVHLYRKLFLSCNTDHLNNRNIWIPDFLKFEFQMVGIQMVGLWVSVRRVDFDHYGKSSTFAKSCLSRLCSKESPTSNLLSWVVLDLNDFLW